MSDPRTLVGLGVSPGIAIGKPIVVENRPLPVALVQLPPEHVDAEVARLHEAATRAATHLAELAGDAARAVGPEYGAIFEAHRLMLEDPTLLDEVERLVRTEAVNAEWALEEVTHHLVAQFDELGDVYLRERREDLLDVALELQRSLQGRAAPVDRVQWRRGHPGRRRHSPVAGAPSRDAGGRRFRFRDRRPHLAHHHHREVARHPGGRRRPRPDPGGRARRAGDRRRVRGPRPRRSRPRPGPGLQRARRGAPAPPAGAARPRAPPGHDLRRAGGALAGQHRPRPRGRGRQGRRAPRASGCSAASSCSCRRARTSPTRSSRPPPTPSCWPPSRRSR